MSLINDALQRAKQVQQTQPPAAGSPLQLRPVDREPETKQRSTFFVWIGFASLPLAGLVAFWLFTRGHSDSTFPGTLKTVAPSPSNPQKVAARVPPTVSEPISTKSPAPVAQPIPTTPQAVTITPATNELVAATVTPAPASKPPLPKLQAIVYSPARPSAILNGRTLYVGSRIAGFRVAAIQPNSVTLVSGTDTNVLQLGED